MTTADVARFKIQEHFLAEFSLDTAENELSEFASWKILAILDADRGRATRRPAIRPGGLDHAPEPELEHDGDEGALAPGPE